MLATDLLCWNKAPFFYFLPLDDTSLVLASVVTACRMQTHESVTRQSRSNNLQKRTIKAHRQVHIHGRGVWIVNDKCGEEMSTAEFRHARPPTVCTSVCRLLLQHRCHSRAQHSSDGSAQRQRTIGVVRTRVLAEVRWPARLGRVALAVVLDVIEVALGLAGAAARPARTRLKVTLLLVCSRTHYAGLAVHYIQQDVTAALSQGGLLTNRRCCTRICCWRRSGSHRSPVRQQ